MPTFDGKDYATDKELVEAVAATLELPRGLVGDEQLAHWRDGLAARGWSIAEQTDTHYKLAHAASGVLADLRTLEYDPAGPNYPVLDPSTEPRPEQLRPAFSTVRLSAPSGDGLLADANLTAVGPDGAVTWLITHTAPGGEGTTDDTATATASPFEGGSRTTFGRLPRSVPIPVILVGGVLLAGVALFLLLRPRGKRFIG